jgi:hypothetical protein
MDSLTHCRTAADSICVLVQSEGQSIKHTDQVKNSARAQEYTTSAPTSMKATPAPAPGMISTPKTTADPADASPAPRTVGLALFDQSRLPLVEASANQAVNATHIFSAEDLILGYRVDILYNSKFY